MNWIAKAHQPAGHGVGKFAFALKLLRAGLDGSQEFACGFQSHGLFPATVVKFRYLHNHEHNP